MAGIRSAAIVRATGSERVARAMPNTPALIGRGIAGLYARETVDAAERILALEVGADDLLQRPCNHRELLARMRALLRRASVGRQGRSAQEASWLVSSTLRTVTRPDRTVISLTPSEYALLTDFMQKPDVLITHENSRTVAGQALTNPRGAMRTNIVRLRRTLGDHDGSVVMTARGRGYFFAPPLIEV